MRNNTNKLNILENSIKPRRAYVGDAGLDLAVQEDVTIQPYSTAFLKSGVSLELDPNFMVFVMSRSSTANKTGLTVMPTLVDYSFNGNEFSTIVSNLTPEPIFVEKGTFLGQAVLMEYQTFINEKDLLDEQRERLNGAKFGSSDKIN